MAKTVTISLAEHKYMTNMIAHDGMTIARLEAELAQAKADIKRLLVIGTTRHMCEYCACDPALCVDCEEDAEWRGWKEGD